jgi:hypothetical protein
VPIVAATTTVQPTRDTGRSRPAVGCGTMELIPQGLAEPAAVGQTTAELVIYQ